MTENKDDPFEELDEAVGDREGDPFERLDSDGKESVNETGSDPPVDPARDENAGKVSEPEQGGMPDFEPEPEPSGQGESVEAVQEPTRTDQQPAEPATPGTGGEEPTPGMSFNVGQRDQETAETEFADVRQRDGDPFDSFEREDVEQVDPDAVWQQLTSAESRGSVGDAQERTYADVSKHNYCEQCEHFSAPPDVHCSHEGTDIVEFLDMETVRVVDCPIVTEREKLEEDDGFGGN